MKPIFAGLACLCLFSTAAAQPEPFTIQVGSLPTRAAAATLVNQLKSRGLDVYYLKVAIPGRGVFYRVRVGRLPTPGEACELGEKLRRTGLITDQFVTTYEAGHPDSADTPMRVSKAPPPKIACDHPSAPASGESPPPPPEKSTRVAVEGRYWITNLRAIANVSGGGLAGTDFNFKSDLGLKDNNLPEVRFTWHLTRRSKLKVDYTQVDYGGDNLLSRTINFNGNLYHVNTRVTSGLEAKQLQLGYAWQFINLKERIKVGPLFEARALWLNAFLNTANASPPIREAKKLTVGLPSIGFDLNVYPHKRINFFAAASGIPAGKYGHFFDGEAGVEFFPAANVRVIGGYRFLDLKARNESDFANLRLAGPFIGAGVRF